MKRRLAAGVSAGVVLVAAGAVAYVVTNRPAPAPSAVPLVAPAVPAVASDAPDAPVTAVVNDGPGKPVPGNLHTIAVKATSGRAVVADRTTKKFSMLGLTWTDPAATVDGTIEVRTRSTRTGKWSSWQRLDAGEPGAEGAEAEKARGATDPLWVGPSDGVAARVRTGGGTAALPAGLRLDLIDPGAATGSSTGGQGGGFGMADPSASASAAPSPSASATPAPVPVTALPGYVSRKGWGADESLVTSAPTIADRAGVMFVHHTADGPATYDCATSAAWVRGILIYHVRSEGWSDLGYNFLVDRCGTLFEGRAGGVTKAVVGAHTYGFNTGSSSIAVLGTYGSTPVTDAARRTISQVSAAVLSRYGADPAGTTTMTEGVTDGKFPYGTVVTFPRISGHRDGWATLCPGDALYAQLPAIRTESATTVFGLASAVGGGVASGGKYYVKGTASLSWSTATAPAGIAKFELLVDGAVQATAVATARSGKVTVPAGTHQLAVRATHVSGTSTTTAAATVISDLTPPTVSTPWLGLRSGTVTTTAVPATVTFTAKDNVKVTWLGVTAPVAKTLTPATTSWSTTTRPGAAQTFRIGAKDLVGNAGTAAIARQTVLTPETTAKRKGAWTAKSASSHLNGKALYTSAKNASLSWTVTGRSFALVGAKLATAGQLAVYLDGKKVATVDTKAAKTTYRQTLWVKNTTAGQHTISVVALGTTGRPGVTIDGLASVR